jgi:peptidoglycan/xylan/chitin deacetylase (PgdA/CDA1 family)
VNSRETAYEYINSLKLQEFNAAFFKLRQNYPKRSITKEIDPVLYKLVSENTVRGFFVDDLFFVGSHSHDHINMANLSHDEMTDQLRRSKVLLEQTTKNVVDSIAFPYGYFNDNVIEQALLAGYKYLIAGGSVESRFSKEVFPRIGILNMAGYSFNMLSISRAFGKFGF